MPIVACSLPNGHTGFRWGEHGHCFPTRAGAEGQAAAAHAARWAADSAMRTAAGVLVRSGDGAVLFLKRGPGCDHPGEWALPAGSLEPGEDGETAARRELSEECGYDAAELSPLHRRVADGLDFTTYSHQIAGKFTPKLNDESSEYLWAKPEDSPQPLHPGVVALLEHLAHRQAADALAMDKAMKVPARPAPDQLAMDKSTSVRTYDEFGRLRVTQANISKANVCPYKGSEIPDAEALGLDPNRVYQLLRDPAALEAAAQSFNGVPLLDTHVPSTAWDHPFGKVMGTTGTDAVWEAPYLKNSLIVWAAEGIEGIESDEQRELSCSYQYRADMTPGDYEGVHYDGRMVDIVGNHVALVAAGRAGPDVIVGDSALDGIEQLNPLVLKGTGMAKKQTLSATAALVRGALLAALPPMLAKDAKLDIEKVTHGVTKKNWKQMRAQITAAIKPKLAADADLDDVVKLLDTLEAVEGTDDMPDDPNGANLDMTADVNPMEEIAAMLKGKVDDTTLASILEKCKGMAPAAGNDGEDPPPVVKKDDKDDGKEKPMSKQAMDEAIKLAVKDTEQRTVARMNAIREAEGIVQPFVGKLSLAFDSAADVYRAALTQIGVKHDGIHESALRAVLEAQQKPGDKARTTPTLAADAKTQSDFLTAYPGAAAIRVI